MKLVKRLEMKDLIDQIRSVTQKDQEKSLPNTDKGLKIDEKFSQRNPMNEKAQQNTPNRGDDIIVLEISQDDVRNGNLSPRGGRYNLRPNPNPNYSEDFRY